MQTSYVDLPLLLWPNDSERSLGYVELVERRRREREQLANPGFLEIDWRRRQVRTGDRITTLPPLPFFWFCVLAGTAGTVFPLSELSRALQASATGQLTLGTQAEEKRLSSLLEDIRRVYLSLFPHAADGFDLTLKRACGQSPNLPSTVSKINRALRHAFGSSAAPFLIEGGRNRGGYRLNVDPTRIVFVDGTPTDAAGKLRA